MTMRVLTVLLAATAVVFAGTACAPGSSTEGESSESDSFWDRTVGGVTDGLDSHIELTEYVSEDTGWRTEPAYGLRPDDFVVLPYANEFLARARLGWIVYNADAVECEPYRWDSDTASAQLATPPRGVVFGTAGGYIDDDVRVIYGKDEARYICRVSSDKMIGFGVPRYLADHVVDALDSYARAITENERAQSAQEDKEAQLDRALAKYCFNPPCRVAGASGTQLGIWYSLVDEPDRKFFHAYNESVSYVIEARRAQNEAGLDAQCWVDNAWSAAYVNHFPQTCGSSTAEATATAVVATATAIRQYDFGDGNGAVPARRHQKGGGLVANTASVAETAYVGPDALIFGNAQVREGASVYGNARIYGNASVGKHTRVFDNAHVFGNASVSHKIQIYGEAQVYGQANIYAFAQIYGEAQVYGEAEVHGDVQIYDNARVHGNAEVFANARISGNAEVLGNTRIYGNVHVSGDAQVYGDALAYDDALINENARVFGNAEIFEDARVVDEVSEGQRR